MEISQQIRIKTYVDGVDLGGLGVQTRLSSMDFFSGRKNPERKSFGRDFKLGVTSLRFQAS